MYESVSDFNNDEPGRLLFAAVSYMYMYTCTSACNIIRERGEGGREGEREGGRGGREGGRERGREGGREGGRDGGREGREGGREGREGRKGEKEREGYNDIHNITAFIKHSIDFEGIFPHVISNIFSLLITSCLCLSSLSLSLPPFLPLSLPPITG